MEIRMAFLGPAALLIMLSTPASANTILFSDLGPSGNAYQCCTGWAVSGIGSFPGVSFTAANEFNSGVGGSVSQIDLAVGESPGGAFRASIWNDVVDLPTTQVAGALWTGLTSSTPFGQCCGLVTISGISGVSLTPGTNYFMILGPMSFSDASDNSWNWNNVGTNGLDLFSTDGGTAWHSNGTTTLGAFDVIRIPEPSSLLLLGTGLLGVLGAVRRKVKR